MVLRKFELYLKKVIRGKNHGFFPTLIKAIFLPLSWFYQIGVICRNRLYDWRWMRQYVPPVPLVISVGNIVAGGTGKTPFTIMLGKVFYEKYSLAILTRGYRSKVENLEHPVVLCEGEGPAYTASYAGDEPFLFATYFPKSLIIVGANRREAATIAGKQNAQVMILDDGFQHRHLAKDLEVVVMDAGDLFGMDYYLPRGFLRDEVQSLSRADLIVINHLKNASDLASYKEKLAPYTRADMIGTSLICKGFKDLRGNWKTISPEERKVAMFCAIAQPDLFKRSLESQNLEVVLENHFADHEEISENELIQFAQICQKKKLHWIICTEKDKVKISETLSLNPPILWMQTELQIIAGLDEWKNFLNRAEKKIK